MKLIKSIMSAFAIVLATTACAGNSGENKKSNEPTKKENKMEVIALNKADFLKKVYNFSAKLLQKSEMRKNMVMDLIYRGFINAANYSCTALLFMTVPASMAHCCWGFCCIHLTEPT